MALRLEDGHLMCSTCHDQHSQEREPFDPSAPAWGGPGTGEGRHFQRVDNQFNQMCADCHAARDVLSSNQGSHPVTVPAASYCSYCHGPHVGLRGLPLPLAENHTLGCITCHAPHYSANDDGTLLQSSNTNAICTTCHWTVDDGPDPSHLDPASGALWPGGQYGSNYPAVAAAKQGFCTNCHSPHGWPDDTNEAQDYRTLLVDFEESLCFTCHDGSPGTEDVRSEFQKASAHPLTMTEGTHDPYEAVVVDSPNRHVECDDCHNSHWATASPGAPGPATAPRAADGPLRHARGVTLTGVESNPAASYEYEVCLRCHGTSTGKPAPPTERQYRPAGGTAHTNTALEFGGTFTSFHTVAVTGTLNTHVPSLYNGWTNASFLACTSCHNNDEGPGASGAGPNGPHGSAWPRLLERRYETGDPSGYQQAKYALCFKCHNPSVVFSSSTSFRRHNLHIASESTSCNVCHDPHASQGQKFLINFDRSVVGPSSSGRLEFNAPPDTGGTGSCYLTCHGENHNPETYSSNY